jgi:hypothetical protein
MKALIVLFFIGWMSFSVIAQITSSSCIASDSIKALYRNDADRLELRQIYDNNLTWVDSVEIPQAESDTILNALIAVYNATSLQARDTVVDIYHIHTFPYPVMNNIAVKADTIQLWMQELANGNLTTGESTIDDLISVYLFEQVTYTDLSWGAADVVTFISDSNYNLFPLIAELNLVPGVNYAQMNSYAGDGNEIYSTVFPDHVELIYQYSWGDCMSGCINNRYWKFKVYYDCSVEFVLSWGTLIYYMEWESYNKSGISVAPNPFQNQLIIEGVNEEYHYEIYSISGEKLHSGAETINVISNLDFLSAGIYILIIQTENVLKTIQVVKEG